MQRALGVFLSILLVSVVLSGCVGGEKAAPVASGDTKKVSGRSGLKAEPELLAKLIAHSAAGEKLDPSAVMAVPPSVDYVKVGVNGPEPSIGVTKNGMIFFQAIAGDTGGPAGPATLRSDDGGKTWKNVAKPPMTAPTTLDPFLWVDPDTDRVFVDHLYVACSYLSISDDYGATWLTNPIACGGPANDHQKIGTGKFRAPLAATPAYKNVVYYGYNAVGGSAATGASRLSVSLDGGLTWPINSQSVVYGACSGGLHGRIRTDSDGRVFVPKRACDGEIVAISENNGVSFENVKMGADVGSAEFRKNPDLAVDQGNNLYMLWPGKDNRMYLSISRDHGRTWSPKSILATPPEITTATMPSAVAGSAGRLAFAYYGVYKGNGESPECVGNDETWDVYVTFTTNALDDNPTFVTTRANDLQDPVQIGGISTNSAAPDPAKNCKFRRNLLDFIDMTMDKQGRVYVATADGCIECTDQAGSVGSMGMVSTQQTGPSMLESVPDFLVGPKGVGG